MAEQEDAPGCWQTKAAYDQCFDQWYKDVFLQQKANGQVGCQPEYKAYTDCYLKELDKEKPLVDTIKSVMPSDVRKRWEAGETQRQPPSSSSNSSDQKDKATGKPPVSK